MPSDQFRIGRGSRFAAVQADVADLSGIAGPFDLVTCQTLLLHVADVPGVLAQMRRLLAPGGTLLLAEPNNFLNRIGMTSVTAGLTPAEFGAMIKQDAKIWDAAAVSAGLVAR